MSLTAEEIDLLSGADVRGDIDLLFLTREDIAATLTVSNIVTLGRVYNIGKFLRAGYSLSATTTMSDVTKQLMFPAASAHAKLVCLSALTVTMTATDDTKWQREQEIEQYEKKTAFRAVQSHDGWAGTTSHRSNRQHAIPTLLDSE
jgi:hypothetical protein